MDPPQQRPESPMEIPMDQQGRRSETPPPRPRPAPAAAAGGDFSAIITVFFFFILIFSFVTFYFSSVASIFFIFIFLFLCFWSSLLNRIIFCSSYLLLNFLLLVWLDFFFLCRLRMVFYHRILKFQSGMLSLFDKFLSSCHQLSSVESITWFLMLCLSLLHHRVLVRV